MISYVLDFWLTFLFQFKTREDINDEYVSLVQGVYSKPILGHLHRGYSLQGAEDVKCESEVSIN